MYERETTSASSQGGMIGGGKAYIGDASGPAMAPPRPQRLDLLLGAGDENLKNASQLLSKIRAVRERLSGSWPEAAGKEAGQAPRSGHIGRLEDQAIDLHKILTMINEHVEHLLGV